jgi:acyl dehydratase
VIDVEFKELASLVGAEAQVSDWILIDQDRVNTFADATNDHQWIHVDVERATQTIGGTIVHGYLILGLLPGLAAGLLNVKGALYAINYGSDRVRFVTMVRTGKRVRLSQKVLSVEPKSGGQMLKCECTIEIEGEPKPACVAETLALIHGS